MSGWPAHVENQVWKRKAAALARGDRIARVKELVARYPHISGAEASEILNYMKRARYVEMEQLASDDTVREQLASFLSIHREQLRYSLSDFVLGFALVVAFLAICWVLWHPIGGG